MIAWLFLVAILFELWYLAAFLAAYARLREPRLLLLVGQALLLLLSFGYIAYSLFTGGSPNLLIAVIPLVLGLLALGAWRSAARGAPRFAQSYPRGIVDVLLFRRPAANLKRRVRTK